MAETRREIIALERRLAALRTLQNCDWKRQPKDFNGATDVYECSRCKAHTANLPLYKDSVCEVRL